MCLFLYHRLPYGINFTAQSLPVYKFINTNVTTDISDLNALADVQNLFYPMLINVAILVNGNCVAPVAIIWLFTMVW